MPLSIVVSNLLKFGIQLLVFVGFYLFYVFARDAQVIPNVTILLMPIVILVMALLGLGLGMLISSMTTKYRDLTFLVQFGVQLLMYGSAVMYPLSYFKEKLPEYAWLVKYNPIAIVIETFRSMTLSTEMLDVEKFVYATTLSVFIFLFGLIVFNRTEKNFIDTV